MKINIANLKPLFATVPKIDTRLNWRDYLGTMKVRLGIGRGSYTVKPGLYAIGKPTSTSDVFVTANYKLSFDVVRENLDGLNGWLLVLDTHGINVWCAAGKGLFGTKELVHRIELSGLKDIVSHRKLIVPQLGAPGVSAREVKNLSGFSVLFGPARATDIKAFIANGYRSTPEMRTVRFTFTDRLKLIPVEIVLSAKYMLGMIALLLVLSGITKEGYSLENILANWKNIGLLALTAYMAGTVITPALLPYIPFRNFSAKGAATLFVIFGVLFFFKPLVGNTIYSISWLMMGAALSSFTAMNFTGTSNYTSLSGVLKEMKYAIPIQIGTFVAGVALFVIQNFIRI